MLGRPKHWAIQERKLEVPTVTLVTTLSYWAVPQKIRYLKWQLHQMFFFSMLAHVGLANKNKTENYTLNQPKDRGIST